MTSVTLNQNELCRLVGRKLSKSEIESALFELGLEKEEEQGDELTFEVTADRPDLLSVEGIARMLRYFYGMEKKMKLPKILRSDFIYFVDKNVEGVRPFITGALVKGLKIDESLIKSLMHIQERLHATLGRNRKKGAIGIHDLDKIAGKKIHYKLIAADSEKFVPLQKQEAMTPLEVLEKHEKGREYKFILEGSKKVPVIYDEKELFSFPPIINAKKTEVTEKTKNILIELTGEDEKSINIMLNILLYNLSERGGQIYSVKIKYKNYAVTRPDFETRKMVVEKEYANRILGTKFNEKNICDLLGKMGFDSAKKGKTIFVSVPPYRADVLHQIDLVDDIGRVYGFNNFEPQYPQTATIGELTEKTKLADAVRNTLIGAGFQDTLNFILTDKNMNYVKMFLKESSSEKCAEIENPYSEQYTALRTWLLPSLLTVLSNNTNKKYPQHICEVGKVVLIDEKEESGVREQEKAAAVLCSLDSQFNSIKAKLQALASAFSAKLETKQFSHKSFIEGRAAKIFLNGNEAGVIGEIHPAVLNAFGIEMPAAAFEIEIEKLV